MVVLCDEFLEFQPLWFLHLDTAKKKKKKSGGRQQLYLQTLGSKLNLDIICIEIEEKNPAFKNEAVFNKSEDKENGMEMYEISTILLLK